MEFDYLAVKPISGPIIPHKQAAKRHYGSHPYFTKRAWNVVQSYIKTFSQPGDTVLDPFGGSGVTAVESLVLKRNAIHLDISPLANFICREIAISPVNIENLNIGFMQVELACKNKILSLYEIKNSVLADSEIPFWYPTGVALPQNADAKTVDELFTHRELVALSTLWHFIGLVEDDIIRDLLKFCFSATLAKVNQTFVSAIGRLESRGGSSIFSMYRYNVPDKPVELNVWDQFQSRFKRIVKAKLETNKEIGSFYSDETFKVIQGSATELDRYIKAESVDYIYTDPPYGGHIAYLDLSTMWHAWLGLKITQHDKELEAIEGGDLRKSKQQYSDLLAESIEQMFRVLKYDRWMSIVFVHKDPAYWDTIVKSSEHAGFQYVNTAVQPVDVVWSMHKKKNPLTVLSGELVLNFRKARNPKTIAITKIGSDVTQLIKNSAEQTIVSNDGGATTEEIYHSLIPILLEHGLLGAVKDKLDDITPLLHQEFVFSEVNSQWQIRENTKLGSFIKLEERIRFYLLDLLKRAERDVKVLTFDEIIQEVMPKLINGTTPEHQTILNVLKKIAYSPDDEHWSMAPIPTSPQVALPFDYKSLEPTKLPQLTIPTLAKDIEHNSLIYRLLKMGQFAGFTVWIGKQEQTANFNGEAFSTLSIQKLPFNEMTPTQEQKVRQIDVIWFNSNGSPAYAFEIETSTTITSALERFSELLELNPKIARKLVIVAPKRRRRKLNQVLEKSVFIGQPLYMETKVMYIFAEDLVNLYHELENTNPSKIMPLLNKLCISPMS